MMVGSSFLCGQCGVEIGVDALGTEHRNHCPMCLWSRHLDGEVPGDRESVCKGMMRPMGLVLKNGDGELMVVHKCMVCGHVSKNRVAGDDKPEVLLKLFEESMKLTAEDLLAMDSVGMKLLGEDNKREVITQLYGKPYAEKYFAEAVKRE